MPEIETSETAMPENSAVELSEPTVTSSEETPESAEPIGDAPSETPDLASDTPPAEAAPGDESALDTPTQNSLSDPPADPADEVQATDPAPQDESDSIKPFEPEEPTRPLAPLPVAQPRIASGPGFMTLLLGGVIAGGIGFAISEYNLFDRNRPDPLALIETRLSEQSSRLDTLTEQASAAAQDAAEAASAASAAATPDDIAALRDEIANLPSGGAADAGLGDRLGAVEMRLDELSAQLAALPADTGASSEALSAYEAQLAALQSELDNQRAAIAEAKTAAADARSASADETRRITVQASLAELGAALENGTPFVDITSALETAGGLTIPAALSDTAASGVATLGALQAEFPAAARDALGVSIRETAGGGVLDRFGAFLRTQTGARSLGAREGDDPDAILSRAEAAVRSGDLSTALEELATLPEAGQAAMAGWVQKAQVRLAATSALADLTATTNSN